MFYNLYLYATPESDALERAGYILVLFGFAKQITTCINMDGVSSQLYTVICVCELLFVVINLTFLSTN